mmetsp:Transcript_100598/g.322939  ORF Transcript_100598/g.322939 Transcript_100598/m.322939 type:complete len:271 (+) Transcript_100598:1120-1932(+)
MRARAIACFWSRDSGAIDLLPALSLLPCRASNSSELIMPRRNRRISRFLSSSSHFFSRAFTLTLFSRSSKKLPTTANTAAPQTSPTIKFHCITQNHTNVPAKNAMSCGVWSWKRFTAITKMTDKPIAKGTESMMRAKLVSPTEQNIAPTMPPVGTDTIPGRNLLELKTMIVGDAFQMPSSVHVGSSLVGRGLLSTKTTLRTTTWTPATNIATARAMRKSTTFKDTKHMMVPEMNEAMTFATVGNELLYGGAFGSSGGNSSAMLMPSVYKL